MIRRCTDENNKSYHNYGGRGITVCKRWTLFKNFLKDMGKRPSSKHTLDRKDNNGNYEKGNCRWVVRKEQMRNIRKNRMITAFGKTMCASAWAEELGMSPQTIISRLNRGDTGERAIRKPS